MIINITAGGIGMTLDKINRGQKIEIVSIPDKNIRDQAIRFGIYEGARVSCFEKLPAGPIVILNRKQEIAVGRKLAEKIQVKLV
jgi:ferrous iron transport protein A